MTALNGQVAIVTGAGQGLGRDHALALANLGATVIIVDVGVSRAGDSQGENPGQAVANEISEAGGTARAFEASVTDPDAIANVVRQVHEDFGGIHILINNAGIIRDKSFAKMSFTEFQSVIDVHLNGSFHCTKAVWPVMQSQNYGRIVMTTSASGLYGNFGQTNYGAAKMALVGLMNTLAIEGQRYNIHVNALAPTALTRMTEELIPPEVHPLLGTQSVAAGAAALCMPDAPTAKILCAGGGCFAAAQITETQGAFLSESKRAAEAILPLLNDNGAYQTPANGPEQTLKFVTMAMQALGIKAPEQST